MNVKKILISVATASIFAISTIGSITASAEDMVIDCKNAKEATSWEQSIIVKQADFNATYMTKDSEIIVTYDCSATLDELTGSPVELVFQSWSGPETPMADEDGKVWAKVAPTQYTESAASFKFQDIVTAYGTADFSLVDAINISATSDAKTKVTSFKVTNCADTPAATTATTTTSAEVESVSDDTTTTTTTAAPAAATTDDNSSSSGTNIGIIIAAITGGVIITIVIIMIIMNKKSSEAFDVSTGKYINKKDAK